MSTTHTITITFDEDEYDRLSAEARRRGVAPDTLAREYVHDSLPAQTAEDDEVLQRTMAALEQLRELREDMRRRGYPSVDAVELIREGRRELEERSGSQWPL